VVELVKAIIGDSEELHVMQLRGFKALLDTYQDFETSPGAETLEKVKWRFGLDGIDQYFIASDGERIGYIRIQRFDGDACRLSQMFILPEHLNKGYAQAAIRMAESLYPSAKKWALDTIKQEPKLCYLYEKMGYAPTGVEKNIKPGMDLVFYEKGGGVD